MHLSCWLYTTCQLRATLLALVEREENSWMCGVWGLVVELVTSLKPLKIEVEVPIEGVQSECTHLQSLSPDDKQTCLHCQNRQI